jgi:hypothetical protein
MESTTKQECDYKTGSFFFLFIQVDNEGKKEKQLTTSGMLSVCTKSDSSP